MVVPVEHPHDHRLQGGGVTEGVAAIVQRDEAVARGAVKPLYLALRGCLRDGPIIAEMCHATDVLPQPEPP